jgi:trimeric autotransporter adhesin
MKHVKFHLPRFLRRVRIHGGEFDSSARAMNRVSEKGSLMTYESAIHAQAEPRIVRGSTIERKHMSTKTTFKRIALVAVAALGFGVLSVVPSQAAVLELTVSTPTAGTAGAVGARTDSTTASTFTVSALFSAGVADTVTVQFVQGPANYPTGATNSGVAPRLAFLETTTSSASVVDTETVQKSAFVTAFAATESVTADGLYSISRSGNGYAGAKFGLFLESATSTTRPAGDYVFTVIVTPYSAGVAGTSVQRPVTITVAAAAAAKAAVGSAATAYLQAGTAVWASAAADSVTAGSLVAGTTIGSFQVKNQSSAGVAAVDTVTVLMTGQGYLTTTGLASNITGRSFVVANVESLTANIVADGGSGTGTITITTGTGASFVKTVTFFDTKPATAKATVKKAYIKAGTGSVKKVFAVEVMDTAGNAVTNITKLTAVATDTATTVGGAAVCSITYDTTDKVYYCEVAGLSATKFGPVAYTITATGADAAATAVKTSATVTFSDVVATKAVLAGPATGTPGATVEYTLTLTDKNGYPVADEIYGAGVEATGGDLFSATATDHVKSGWTGTLPFSHTDSFTSVSGVITSKGVLPIAGVATGSWTLVGDGIQTLAGDAIDKTIGKTKVTVSTEVTNPGVDAATDAANEATDAANAATDAALAAAEAADAATTAAQEASDAVAALSASVTKLIEGLQAQIKSLAAVVAKIAKKVKA